MGRGVAEAGPSQAITSMRRKPLLAWEQFPKTPWSYITWGDFYHFRRQNVVRSRELYSKAVRLASEQGGPKWLSGRLEMLNRGV